MARTILADHAPTSIKDLPDGEIVKVVGRVALQDEALIAPTSARRCVAYYVMVDKVFAPRRKERSPGDTLIRERQIVPHLVEDETGRAFVCVDDVEVVVQKDVHREVWAGTDPRVDALLRAHGRTPQHVDVREGSIDVGEWVAVVGRVRRRPGFETFRGGSEIVELVAPDEHPLILSDDPETFD